jgi:hypothetical protein
MRTVHHRDLAGFIRKMPKERHAAAVRAIRVTMRTRARVVFHEEILATKPRPPFDRGEFDRSGKVIPIDDGARFFSSSPYASVINRGRRPGTWPNITALMGWVKRHNLVEKSPEKARAWAAAKSTFMGFLAAQRMSARKTMTDYTAASIKSIAWAIAAKIKRDGLPAKKVFDRTSARLVVELKAAVRAAFAGKEAAGP